VSIAKYENLPEQISHLVKRQTVEGAAHSMPGLLSTSMTPWNNIPINQSSLRDKFILCQV